jgi:hypothetical protein
LGNECPFWYVYHSRKEKISKWLAFLSLELVFMVYWL